jgi:DNA-binding NarL/FixJ family response regulator/DNA-binding phage protein
MDKEIEKTAKMRPDASRPIRILIVDDHPVVRAGLTSMLATIPDLEVVGSASDGKDALDAIAATSPDILLLDLRMPRLSGAEVLKALRAMEEAPRAIILTSYESNEDIYQAILGGAYGYLLKACSEEEMLDAIHAVYAGQRYLPLTIASRLAERIPRLHLNELHTELLDLLARRVDDKQAAHQLNMTVPKLWQRFNMILDSIDLVMPTVTEPAVKLTIADVARKAGVSMATVSRVLHNKGNHSEETQRAVLKIVNQYDFQLNGTAASLAMMRASSTEEEGS